MFAFFNQNLMVDAIKGFGEIEKQKKGYFLVFNIFVNFIGYCK